MSRYLQLLYLKNGCQDFSLRTQPYASQPQTNIPSFIYLEETPSKDEQSVFKHLGWSENRREREWCYKRLYLQYCSQSSPE